MIINTVCFTVSTLLTNKAFNTNGGSRRFSFQEFNESMNPPQNQIDIKMENFFSLKWKNFQPNVTKSFQRLRHEKDYSDVTLIGDDFQPLWAHKVVLSSSSEYFKNVLYSTINHSNPVLCMEGYSKGDLTNVLDYIYIGELQIPQEDLDTFLTVAERLKLDGLAGKETKIDEKDNILSTVSLAELLSDPYPLEMKQKQPKPYSKKGLENKMVVIKSGELSDQELNEKLDELSTLDTSGMYICNFCSKRTTKSHIREHVEIHVDGLQFPCNLCEKSYRSRNALRNHNNRDHRSKTTLDLDHRSKTTKIRSIYIKLLKFYFLNNEKGVIFFRSRQ